MTAGGQIIENPCSFFGSARRLWPLGHGSEGWVAVARWSGVVLLVALAWVGVLAVYTLLCTLPVLWIPWAIVTLRRRHFVYDSRRYGRKVSR